MIAAFKPRLSKALPPYNTENKEKERKRKRGRGARVL